MHEPCEVHRNVALTLTEEKGTTYTFRDGEITEAHVSYDVEPRDEIIAFCNDCETYCNYDHYQDAPEWLQRLYDAAYKREYDEDHGYSTR